MQNRKSKKKKKRETVLFSGFVIAKLVMSILQTLLKRNSVVVLLAAFLLLCDASSQSLEYWPAKMIHRPLSDDPLTCRVGEAFRTELVFELSGDRDVWIGLRIEGSSCWNASAPLPLPFLYRTNTGNVTFFLSWVLAVEPFLNGHNVSVSLPVADVVAVVALSSEMVLASPLRLLRAGSRNGVLVKLNQSRPWIRYILAVVLSCLVCAVLYFVAARHFDTLDCALAQRLQHEQRLANVSPDSVVGGVKIFSTKGKVIKRFGGKKN
jgi:hypothetical protein